MSGISYQVDYATFEFIKMNSILKQTKLQIFEILDCSGELPIPDVKRKLIFSKYYFKVTT